ncbi:hypothetical protein ACOCEA_17445 [Maribacter sp. CXY002]|uniref:hypothetical protein n=1 Tax=Maribacter luteocoastalis TaxID=3407671 RepID=UPI003B684436
MVHKHFRETEAGNLKPTNYEKLLDDTTYKNMVAHRAGFRAQALVLKRKALNNTKQLVELIELELQK